MGTHCAIGVTPFILFFFFDSVFFFATTMDRLLVVLVPDVAAHATAQVAAVKLNCHFVDPDSLFGSTEITSVLGAERFFCTVSEIAIRAAKDGCVVVGGPPTRWSEKKGAKPCITIVPKLRKMLFDRIVDFVVLHASSEAASLADLKLPATTPTCEISGTDIDVCDALDLVALRHRTVPTDSITCNQLRVIYLDVSSTAKHETVLFDAKEARTFDMRELSALPAWIDVDEVRVDRPNGCTLVLLPSRQLVGQEMRSGQHITVDAGKTEAGGPRAPVGMRAVAISLEQGEVEAMISEKDKICLANVQCRRVRIRPLAWAFDAFA